ncbi:hypothetical protein AB6E95_11775 [Vibrio splendidus]|uniref:Uncharacterized protein n=2 Tax=Vibrio TaxID=662 RepID=A0ABV4LVZ8_VIBSP
MANVIGLERINNNQQVKVTVNCADNEVKAQLTAFINENKNSVNNLEVYPMATAGNKSESEVLNFVLSFGTDVLEAVKDELVSVIVGYVISELKSKKQEYVVKDKDRIISNERSEDKGKG